MSIIKRAKLLSFYLTHRNEICIINLIKQYMTYVIRSYEMQFTPTQEQQGIIECEALPYWNIN